jgi:hypothetical protein
VPENVACMIYVAMKLNLLSETSPRSFIQSVLKIEKNTKIVIKINRLAVDFRYEANNFISMNVRFYVVFTKRLFKLINIILRWCTIFNRLDIFSDHQQRIEIYND